MYYDKIFSFLSTLKFHFQVRNYYPGGRETKTYRAQGVQTYLVQKSLKDVGITANLIGNHYFLYDLTKLFLDKI